jgi:hypothetical protein
MVTVQSLDSAVQNDTATRTVKLQAAAQVLQVRISDCTAHAKRAACAESSANSSNVLLCRASATNSPSWQEPATPLQQLGMCRSALNCSSVTACSSHAGQSS